MKKFIFSICLLLSFSLSGWSQVPDNKILWDENRPLEWKDFQAAPNPNNPFYANTNTGISYSWSFRASGDELEFVYDVYSFFLPENSWMRSGKGSENLLAHEQLHFDITELHARKLRKKLKEFDPTSVKDLKKTLGEMYRRMEAERKAMQEKFDADTDHSIRANVQLEWQKRIQQEMSALEDFSS